VGIDFDHWRGENKTRAKLMAGRWYQRRISRMQTCLLDGEFVESAESVGQDRAAEVQLAGGTYTGNVGRRCGREYGGVNKAVDRRGREREGKGCRG